MNEPDQEIINKLSAVLNSIISKNIMLRLISYNLTLSGEDLGYNKHIGSYSYIFFS